MGERIMNQPTAFDTPREAAKTPRRVFYPTTQEIREEGHYFNCPHCGERMAWATESRLSQKLNIATYYVLTSARIWAYPQRGVQLSANSRQRERECRARAHELQKQGASPEEIKRELDSLRRFQKNANRRLVTNIDTGERKRMGEKGGFVMNEVERDALFQCRRCKANVKIKVSNE